jgi:hypothetical protein
VRRIAAALVLALPCHAGAQAWASTDSAMLAGAVGLTVLDWGQTRHLASRPDIYAERNPALPLHPSQHQVDRHFALAIAGTIGLAYALPQSERRLFLGGLMVLESAVVVQNHRIGLELRF